ncbi:hypothetical protein [Burkholderia ambifaria]|uniref:hypothetical protein n=1 Tax=Burkholderia ambifaria TaxID=152480 RepID=UPI0015884B84|nr:hypothetical protein [Burkholderia ambifaria]
MSNYVRLQLHKSEEAVQISAPGLMHKFPGPTKESPIQEYFETANSLTAKIATSEHSDDAEILGLMLLGIVSAAEFYFRSALGGTLEICPISQRHAESINIPIAASQFYLGSGYSPALGSFEHESLADAKKIRGEIKKFTGFDIQDDTSANQAVEQFETLCELRHCLVHARGFAGLKACRALKSSERQLQKLLVGKTEAFELIKLSHNAVRAVNRFLVDSILNRWIDRDVLVGTWQADKKQFVALIEKFWVKGEDSFGSAPQTAYEPVKRVILMRKRAMAAKVAPPPPNATNAQQPKKAKG